MLMDAETLNIFARNKYSFYPVVKFDPFRDKLLKLDFSVTNQELTRDIFEDTAAFTRHIQAKLEKAGCRLGIGGYKELRDFYGRSEVFDGDQLVEEPRRLHLGTDIWGPAGTPVFAPIGGMVHSFAFNDKYGDYGATIVLLHQLEGSAFYTLYGHVSLRDIDSLREGQYVIRGEEIAHFGEPHENGYWPPHLHFQVIFDMGVYEGDYPGVCRFSEKEKFLANCPDPDLVLQMNRYLR
jgi:murein DD-endopeptidase MepM/ murein hydrolase activator NlpD